MNTLKGNAVLRLLAAFAFLGALVMLWPHTSLASVTTDNMKLTQQIKSLEVTNPVMVIKGAVQVEKIALADGETPPPDDQSPPSDNSEMPPSPSVHEES